MELLGGIDLHEDEALIGENWHDSWLMGLPVKLNSGGGGNEEGGDSERKFHIKLL